MERLSIIKMSLPKSTGSILTLKFAGVCVCVCVCVYMREKERETGQVDYKIHMEMQRI